MNNLSYTEVSIRTMGNGANLTVNIKRFNAYDCFPHGSVKAVKYSVYQCIHAWIAEYCFIYKE